MSSSTHGLVARIRVRASRAVGVAYSVDAFNSRQQLGYAFSNELRSSTRKNAVHGRSLRCAPSPAYRRWMNTDYGARLKAAVGIDGSL
jgi:hypothetical protein